MKLKYDVKGVEKWGTGEPIPKGTYTCVVDSCEVTKPDGKDERIEVVYKIVGDGPAAGRKLYDYVNLESEAAKGKLRQFLESFEGLVTAKKESGTVDLTKLIGTQLTVRVIHQAGRGAYEGQTQARVGSTHLLEEGAEVEDEDLDADEDEDEDEDEEDEAEVDLDEMDRAELKKLIKENELGLRVKSAWSDDELREKIAETMAESEDEDEDEDEDEPPDYNAMDEAELAATLKERGLKTTGSKKLKVGRLTKDDETDDDGDPF